MLNGNEMKAFYRIFFPKRPDEGVLSARVPDVNETRLNDNFKTIGDEFRKIWEFIKNGFKTKSLTVDGDASVGGQLSAGSATLGDTNVTGTLDVDGSATFGGVLDITKRRCYATLSSAGWYRVMSYTATSATNVTGGVAFSVDFTLFEQARQMHKITLNGLLGVFGFGNEYSVTGTENNITKIRYTYDTNNVGYVDVYFAGSSRSVGCCFSVYTRTPVIQQRFVAESLQSVAASPSGETVLTEYSFANNTEGDVSSSFSSSKGGFNAYRCGKMVTVTFLGNFTTWTTDEVVGTIGSDVIPALSYIDVVGYIGRQAVVVRLNQNGNITLWIGSTLTGNQRLYFSFTYPIL